MSGHKGPWVRPSGNVVRLELTYVHEMWREYDGGNGRHILTHDELPADAVPLVPQTEVDAAKAERDRWHKLLSAIGRELETDSGGWFYDDLPKMAKALKLELAEAKAENTALSTTLAGYQQRARSAPSLPAVDFKDTEESLPQKLRAAAYLVDMQFDRLRCGDRPVASILYDEADRLEREQAEKAKRDRVTDELLNLVSGARTVGVQIVVDELLDRFDITPKP